MFLSWRREHYVVSTENSENISFLCYGNTPMVITNIVIHGQKSISTWAKCQVLVNEAEDLFRRERENWSRSSSSSLWCNILQGTILSFLWARLPPSDKHHWLHQHYPPYRQPPTFCYSISRRQKFSDLHLRLTTPTSGQGQTSSIIFGDYFGHLWPGSLSSANIRALRAMATISCSSNVITTPSTPF